MGDAKDSVASFNEAYKKKHGYDSPVQVYTDFKERLDRLEPVNAYAKDTHRKAFLDARKEILGSYQGKKFGINERWLSEGNDEYSAKDIQEKFIDKMLDLYKTHLEEQLGTKIEDDEISSYLQAHYGITARHIRDMVKDHKGNLTLSTFERQIVPRFDQTIDASLYQNAAKNIDSEHILGLQEYLGIDKYLTAPLDLQEMHQVLQLHHSRKGEIGALDLEQIVGKKVKARSATHSKDRAEAMAEKYVASQDAANDDEEREAA